MGAALLLLSRQQDNDFNRPGRSPVSVGCGHRSQAGGESIISKTEVHSEATYVLGG